MLDDNPEILHDLELEGVMIEGLSVGQVKKLRTYYQKMTGDMDLESLDAFTKGL